MNRNRKCHILKENRIAPFPKQFIFVDVESKQASDELKTYHTLKLGWACAWRRYPDRNKDTLIWFKFTQEAEFWQWLLERFNQSKKIVLISHNANFDLTVLQSWIHLGEADFRCTLPIISNDNIIIKFKKDDMTLLILDNVNYFKSKLATIGELIGLPKAEVNFETVSEEALSNYCKRDVEILLRLWQRFVHFMTDENLGGFAPTVASLAMRSFRHKFMKHPIFIHNNLKAIELEREGYFGGRCEAFKLGNLSDQIYYNLDVNSMYPSVMESNDFPTKLIRIGGSLSLKDLKVLLQDKLVVARVVCQANQAIYPLKAQKKLSFPIGTFKTTLCTPELQIALQRKELITVLGYSLYEKAPIFQGYVQAWWQKRKATLETGDQVMNHFYKLMLNSLYGKFGQKNSPTKVIGECHPSLFERKTIIKGETGETYTWTYFGGKIFETRGEAESFDSMVAIAAHVTSYARVKLASLLDEAGEGNFFYVDTDSVIVNEIGYQKLSHRIKNGELGYLGLKKTSSHLVIRGLKDYEFGKDTVRKAIKANAIEIAPNSFEQDKWLSLIGLLRQGKGEVYFTQKVIKNLRRNYLKGGVLDSNIIKPLIFKYQDNFNWLDLDTMEETYSDIINFQDLEKLYPSFSQIENQYDQQAMVADQVAVKEFRAIILDLGGVKDPIYESLPRWCKRNASGRPLDELVLPLQERGYFTETANELYAMLWDNS